MAMLLFKRKIQCFLLPSSSTRKFAHHLYSSKIQNPSPTPSFIVGYMMESFGFSLEKATKASKYIIHIHSPSKPDSVVRFFKQNGLSDTQIATLVSHRPRVLCSNVENTLKPKIRQLREVGFSDSEILQFLVTPYTLISCDLKPKIATLKCLFRSNAELLGAFRGAPQLLNSSLKNKLIPSISLLRGYGISDDDIGKIVVNLSSFNPTLIDETMKWAEELGFTRQSGTFKHALYNLQNIGRTRFGAKFEFLKSLGWSEAEVFSAIRKQPVLLALSEKKIRNAMNFWTKEAELEPSFVAYRPILVMFSLKKRLLPRFCVLRVLKREELIPKRHDTSAFIKTQKVFLEKYIHPHVVKVPGLLDGYLAACSGNLPIQWKS